MKSLRYIPLLLAACVGLVWADTQSDIDDLKSEKAALQSELKKLDVRVTQTDSISKEEARRFTVTSQRQTEDLERRKADLDTIQVKIAAVAKDLQTEKNQQSSSLISVENAKAFRTGLAKSLGAHCLTLENLMKTSLPWDLEIRLERVQSLRRDLENGSAPVEEGLSRLRALYQEEIRFGDEVVVINRPMIRKDGETINARVLRIGNQWMVYSDEENTKFGVLVRNRSPKGDISYTWKEDLNFEERTAVKLALDVKQARKPPQMVRLPLSLSIAEVK